MKFVGKWTFHLGLVTLGFVLFCLSSHPLFWQGEVASHFIFIGFLFFSHLCFYPLLQRHLLPALAMERLKFFLSLGGFLALAYSLLAINQHFEKRLGSKNYSFAVGNCVPLTSLFLKNRMGQDILNFTYRLSKLPVQYTLYTIEDYCRIKRLTSSCQELACWRDNLEVIERHAPLLSLPKYYLISQLILHVKQEELSFDHARELLSLWSRLDGGPRQGRALQKIRPGLSLKSAREQYHQHREYWEGLWADDQIPVFDRQTSDGGLLFLDRQAPLMAFQQVLAPLSDFLYQGSPQQALWQEVQTQLQQLLESPPQRLPAQQ